MLSFAKETLDSVVPFLGDVAGPPSHYDLRFKHQVPVVARVLERSEDISEVQDSFPWVDKVFGEGHFGLWDLHPQVLQMNQSNSLVKVSDEPGSVEVRSLGVGSVKTNLQTLHVCQCLSHLGLGFEARPQVIVQRDCNP